MAKTELERRRARLRNELDLVERAIAAVDDEAALDHCITAFITIPFGPFRFEREIALS